jgi:hypothetical protein
MAHGDICHGGISEIIDVGLDQTFWIVGDVRIPLLSDRHWSNGKSFCRASILTLK